MFENKKTTFGDKDNIFGKVFTENISDGEKEVKVSDLVDTAVTVAHTTDPIGNIIAYMGTIPPVNYLVCDGTIYNIEDYQDLANYFERQFGNKNYFGGDGTTTFAVPDLRGEFLRGTGTNSHTNQGSGANVGVHQDGTEHFNFYKTYEGSSYFLSASSIKQSEDGSAEVKNSDSKTTSISGNMWWVVDGTNTTSRNNRYTSRPTNTSVLYCIRYNIPISSEVNIWQPNTEYSYKQFVFSEDGGLYTCKADHKSGSTFMEDLLAGKWSWIGKEGANNVTQTTLYTWDETSVITGAGTVSDCLQFTLTDDIDKFDFLSYTINSGDGKRLATGVVDCKNADYSTFISQSFDYGYNSSINYHGTIYFNLNNDKRSGQWSVDSKSSGTISSLHLVSVTGIKLNTFTTADIAEMAMPSDVYVNLNRGTASGVAFNYTAPANGWICWMDNPYSSNSFMRIECKHNDIYKAGNTHYGNLNTDCIVTCPITKGDTVGFYGGGLTYNAYSTIRFFYSVGDAKALGLI